MSSFFDKALDRAAAKFFEAERRYGQQYDYEAEAEEEEEEEQSRRFPWKLLLFAAVAVALVIFVLKPFQLRESIGSPSFSQTVGESFRKVTGLLEKQGLSDLAKEAMEGLAQSGQQKSAERAVRLSSAPASQQQVAPTPTLPKGAMRVPSGADTCSSQFQPKSGRIFISCLDGTLKEIPGGVEGLREKGICPKLIRPVDINRVKWLTDHKVPCDSPFGKCSTVYICGSKEVE